MNENTIDEKTVRKAMIDLGLTQRAIAKKLGRHPQHIYQVLKGLRKTPGIIAYFNEIVNQSKSMRKAS